MWCLCVLVWEENCNGVFDMNVNLVVIVDNFDYLLWG